MVLNNLLLEPFSILIDKLEVPVNIGTTISERNKVQLIQIQLSLYFQPYDDRERAEIYDDIQSTICYHNMCTMIYDTAQSHDFHLIEMLMHCLLYKIESYVIQQCTMTQFSLCKLALTVYKKPKIKGLKGKISCSVNKDY